MLERQYQLPRRPGINQRRAGTYECGRLRKAGTAQRRGVAVVRQRQAAAGALRRAKRLQLGKTDRAKPVVTVDDLAAAWAARRQYHIDDCTQRRGDQGKNSDHGGSLRRGAAGVKMQVMADPLPFDAALRRRRHAQAAAGCGEASFLHDLMADELRERAAMVARPFADVLDLGGPAPVWPGAVRAALAACGAAEAAAGRLVVADEDMLPFADGSFDLVVSAGGLATVNDLPGALAGIRRVLRPDGLFLAAFVGGMSLVELRACLLEAEAAIAGGAGTHTAPMVEASAAAGLLTRAGFAMPVADVERVTLRYASLFGLFADLAAMGARSVLRRRRPLRRDVLALAAERFAAMADANGKTAVTIEILHVAGWAPGPGQPSPKAPGSASTSLAAALKSRV